MTRALERAREKHKRCAKQKYYYFERAIYANCPLGPNFFGFLLVDNYLPYKTTVFSSPLPDHLRLLEDRGGLIDLTISRGTRESLLSTAI